LGLRAHILHPDQRFHNRHLIGAPLAPEAHSEVPAAPSHRFIVVVAITSLLFWALPGVATSIAFGRISRPQL